MRADRRRVTVLAAIAAALLALTACTTVPDSSAPQTVQPVRLDRGDTASAEAPQRNASPQVIVSDFLDANSADPVTLASARQYLTSTASNQWRTDQLVTIVADRQIGDYNAKTGTINVTGRVIGRLNASGIYTPSIQGTGDGGPAQVFPFTLKKVSGQYRIDQLRSGLLITDDQFRATYQQHVVYFYDLSEKYLVPDIRWSEIPSTDSGQLATWLVDQLVSPPRSELTDVVSTDTFPAQVDADRIIVRAANGNMRIEIPGSSQLDPDVRDRLAKQLARTLDEVLSGGTLTITDNGAPIIVPDLATTSFTADSFVDPPGPDPDVYYLDAGHVTDQTGHTVPGPLSQYYLTSVALSRPGGTGPLQVAATEGSGTDARLFLGSQTSGLHSTSVHGTLTRPAWAPNPNLHEVWIGVGSAIHRVTVSGSKYTDSVVQTPLTSGGGQIRSVRLSPDGTQVALVITGAGGAGGTLYVGAVVRDAGTVRVSGTEQVSPPGVVVTDADWSNSLRLAAIGYIGTPDHGEVYDSVADGSFWANRGFSGLPGPPVSITASTYGTWVEAGSQIWYQSGTGWSNARKGGQPAYGIKPVYLS
jgi:hypothetical protein